jgi:hypothetical protein
MGLREDYELDGFRPLFDGKTLRGWHAVPRLPTAQWPGGPEPDTGAQQYKTAAATHGNWEVIDGAISGTQELRGFGGYLLSDEVFADFEIVFEARPDWPADTGLLVRTTERGSQGFQILLDHRKSGAIGGFYGNGIGQFHAISFNVDAVYDDTGKAIGLMAENSETTLEPVTDSKRSLLNYAIGSREFLEIWRWGEWNQFKVRCEGEYPVLTSWINGTKAYEMDTSAINHPNYDRDAVRRLLGRAGHIALEIHNNDPRMGEARWGLGVACRWRNIAIKVL